MADYNQMCLEIASECQCGHSLHLCSAAVSQASFFCWVCLGNLLKTEALLRTRGGHACNVHIDNYLKTEGELSHDGSVMDSS